MPLATLQQAKVIGQNGGSWGRVSKKRSNSDKQRHAGNTDLGEGKLDGRRDLTREGGHVLLYNHSMVFDYLIYYIRYLLINILHKYFLSIYYIMYLLT